MAQLEACPTGDMGHGFDPSQVRQHSFMEIDHEIFSTVIVFPSPDSRKTVTL